MHCIGAVMQVSSLVLLRSAQHVYPKMDGYINKAQRTIGNAFCPACAAAHCII